MLDSMYGSGTEQDPYLITTLKELQAIYQELDAYYELANDIDASNSILKPIGDDKNSFTGTFDGNNNVIRNLFINRPEENYVGLFSCIGKRGQVKNLGLTSPRIEGINDVGSFAGHNRGEIVCSYVKGGHVSGNRNVGGLVGENSEEVESLYAIEVDVSGNNQVGGIVGINFETVNLSHIDKVDVSADGMGGGIVGYNRGEIESSYSVKSDISAGLVGSNRGSGKIKRCHLVGDNSVDSIIGRNYGEPSESSFVLSDSGACNILETADLVLSRGNHTISYFVETKTLYVQVDNEIYSGGDLSPVEVQPLLEGSELVKKTETFEASVVMAT